MVVLSATFVLDRVSATSPDEVFWGGLLIEVYLFFLT
jgi:hypothetical protein